MKKAIIFAVAYLCLASQSIAQSNIDTKTRLSLLEKSADQLFYRYAYTKALDKYIIVHQKDTTNGRVILKIAETYRQLNDPDNAVIWYRREIDVNEETIVHSAILNYAQMLMSLQKYDEAKKWFQIHADHEHEDGFLKNINNKITSIDRIHFLIQDNKFIQLKEVAFNSKNADFSPVLFKDELYFVSGRKVKHSSGSNYSIHGNFLDFFKVGSDGRTVEHFYEKYHSRLHEGPFAFTANGEEMMFTRNSKDKGLGENGDNHTVHLTMLSAKIDKKTNDWGMPVPFPFNNINFSVGHPTYSHDGNTLYFVSDISGGLGKTDIYKSERIDDGWKTPVNLGNLINTESREMFPYLYADQYLYFASDGHPGLGGLDIFVVDLKNLKKTEIVNLGSPINSPLDDFGITLEENGLKGYFSSNRKESGLDDDIFMFESKVGLFLKYHIKTIVTDKRDNTPLANAMVYLKIENQVIDSMLTDSYGMCLFEVNNNTNYVVSSSKSEFSSNEKNISTFDHEKEVWEVKIPLTKRYLFSMYGLIEDKESKEPLEGVMVTMKNNLTEKGVIKIVTSINGDFEKNITEAKLRDKVSYTIKFEKQGYLSKKLTFETALEKPGRVDLRDFLEVDMDKIDIGIDIGKLIDINPIYFDLNKYNIRADARKELDKIVEVMFENPIMMIELASHTDCRGSAKYNERLSDKRAKSSANYIRTKIENPKRIYGKGYGESHLINKCACEGKSMIPCTEEQHQENRRTEFTIIKF